MSRSRNSLVVVAVLFLSLGIVFALHRTWKDLDDTPCLSSSILERHAGANPSDFDSDPSRSTHRSITPSDAPMSSHLTPPAQFQAKMELFDGASFSDGGAGNSARHPPSGVPTAKYPDLATKSPAVKTGDSSIPLSSTVIQREDSTVVLEGPNVPRPYLPTAGTTPAGISSSSPDAGASIQNANSQQALAPTPSKSGVDSDPAAPVSVSQIISNSSSGPLSSPSSAGRDPNPNADYIRQYDELRAKVGGQAVMQMQLSQPLN